MESIRVLVKPEVRLGDTDRLGARTTEWRVADFTLIWKDKPYSKTWASKDGKATIKYIQDPLRGVRYYSLTGTDLAHHRGLIQKRLATYDRAEIEGMMRAAGTPAEKVAAIYHAAVVAPPGHDLTIFDFLVNALTDETPAVRRAAIDATLVAMWRELRTPLEQVAVADPDVDLREFAQETLETLHSRVWNAVTGGTAAPEPIPPDPRRVTPASGAQEGNGVTRAGGTGEPTGTGGGQRSGPQEPIPLPAWFVRLREQGDWSGVHWHTPDQVRGAANSVAPFVPDSRMAISPRDLSLEQSLWERMVPVGDGPELTDRTGDVEKSRLHIARDNPEQLFLALGLKHPPSLWVPAGQSRETVDVMVASYFFPGIPSQATLPFQGRLFLTTQGGFTDGFRGVENRLVESPFCDALIWGSSQPTDPYPERVTLGRIPAPELRRFIAQIPRTLPRTSTRTRFSRSVIQLIDYHGAYFADLFFRPAPHPELGVAYNTRFETEFPPATPVDVIGALSGFACFGAVSVRAQAARASDPEQRSGMEEIITFLEQIDDAGDAERV